MTGPPELSPEQVRRAQAGDRAALDRIVRRLEPILRGYFIRRIGLRPVVDDLIQNTLLRVVNGLGDLHQPEGFMGFVMKGALFELQDLYRGRYGGREALYDPEAPPERDAADAPSGLAIDLKQALDRLTPHARRILELKEYGYRYKEIADMLETTEAAVKMQVKRAFERLRRLLGGDEDSDE